MISARNVQLEKSEIKVVISSKKKQSQSSLDDLTVTITGHFPSLD
jgi:hypothetical protein